MHGEENGPLRLGPGSGANGKGQEKVDLLLTAIVLPGGMNGVDPAREARELRPGLCVLYRYGYAVEAILRQGRGEASFELISKPFGRAQLSRRLRDVLGRTST